MIDHDAVQLHTINLLLLATTLSSGISIFVNFYSLSNPVLEHGAAFGMILSEINTHILRRSGDRSIFFTIFCNCIRRKAKSK